MDPSGKGPRLSRRRFLRIAGVTGLGGLATAVLRATPARSLRALAARRSGLPHWSDPRTWGGRVPGPDDVAIVTQKIVLNVDAQVRGVIIKRQGALIFHPRRSVTLRTTGNVVVRGRLRIRPGGPAVVHRLQFLRIDERRFVGGGMRVLRSDVGLWVTGNGVLDVAGSPKLAWTTAMGAIPAGSTTLVLRQAPAGWRVGDEVVVTPTLPPSDPNHFVAYDVGIVGAVDQLGRTITLTLPTKFEHPAVEVRPGVVRTAEVLNLTRNTSLEGSPTGRSHIWIRSSRPQHLRNASIRYTGPRRRLPSPSLFTEPVPGRYGLHFHVMGRASRTSSVAGVVVRDSGNHAFVTHQSHGVTFRDCIAHDTFEDAYWWDPASDKETDGTKAPPTNDVLYDRCVASKVRADPTTDGLFRLAGFFLGARKGNMIRNCVAVGVQGGDQSCGFIWHGSSIGLWKLENCVAHNNRSNGITVWQTTSLLNVVNRFTAYHNGGTGIFHGQYWNGFQYKDSILYANGAAGINVLATSFPEGDQVFWGLHCDQANLSPYCVVGTQRIKSPQAASRFVECRFRGFTKAAFGFVDPRPFPNLFSIVDCTFEGNEFWLGADIDPATSIHLQDPVHGSLTLRRVDQPGVVRPEWNASLTGAASGA